MYQSKNTPQILCGKSKNPSWDEIVAPEVELIIHGNESNNPPQFHSSLDLAKWARSFYTKGTIELREEMLVLLLDASNQLKGYYRHTVGTIGQVLVDVRLVLAAALRAAAPKIVLVHNHPAGTLKPSELDVKITHTVQKAAATMSIELLDHIILTEKSYFSLSDQGMMMEEPSFVSGVKEKNEVTVMRRRADQTEWQPITLTEAVRQLEGAGYWKEGTTVEMLKQHLQLWTPFAQFCIPKPGQTLQGPEQNVEDELRLEIRRHLDKCDAEATPRICHRTKTTDGYRDVEDAVIRLMLHDELTAGAAIAQLEMEYE